MQSNGGLNTQRSLEERFIAIRIQLTNEVDECLGLSDDYKSRQRAIEAAAHSWCSMNGKLTIEDTIGEEQFIKAINLFLLKPTYYLEGLTEQHIKKLFKLYTQKSKKMSIIKFYLVVSHLALPDYGDRDELSLAAAIDLIDDIVSKQGHIDTVFSTENAEKLLANKSKTTDLYPWIAYLPEGTTRNTLKEVKFSNGVDTIEFEQNYGLNYVIACYDKNGKFLHVPLLCVMSPAHYTIDPKTIPEMVRALRGRPQIPLTENALLPRMSSNLGIVVADKQLSGPLLNTVIDLLENTIPQLKNLGGTIAAYLLTLDLMDLVVRIYLTDPIKYPSDYGLSEPAYFPTTLEQKRAAVRGNEAARFSGQATEVSMRKDTVPEYYKIREMQTQLADKLDKFLGSSYSYGVRETAINAAAWSWYQINNDTSLENTIQEEQFSAYIIKFVQLKPPHYRSSQLPKKKSPYLEGLTEQHIKTLFKLYTPRSEKMGPAKMGIVEFYLVMSFLVLPDDDYFDAIHEVREKDRDKLPLAIAIDIIKDILNCKGRIDTIYSREVAEHLLETKSKNNDDYPWIAYLSEGLPRKIWYLGCVQPDHNYGLNYVIACYDKDRRFLHVPLLCVMSSAQHIIDPGAIPEMVKALRSRPQIPLTENALLPRMSANLGVVADKQQSSPLLLKTVSDLLEKIPQLKNLGGIIAAYLLTLDLMDLADSIYLPKPDLEQLKNFIEFEVQEGNIIGPEDKISESILQSDSEEDVPLFMQQICEILNISNNELLRRIQNLPSFDQPVVVAKPAAPRQPEASPTLPPGSNTQLGLWGQRHAGLRDLAPPSRQQYRSP